MDVEDYIDRVGFKVHDGGIAESLMEFMREVHRVELGEPERLRAALRRYEQIRKILLDGERHTFSLPGNVEVTVRGVSEFEKISREA